jgi:RNA polymerase-binding transcription factor DksA
MATTADILGSARTSKIPARWREHLERLSAERDRLMARDRSAPTASSAKMDDLTDAAAEESQRNLSLVAASATQDMLAEVLGALHRIERGTYGICEITGKSIEPGRLKAIPWARYSLEGQNELERNGFGRKHVVPALESLRETVVVDGEEAAESDEGD